MFLNRRRDGAMHDLRDLGCKNAVNRASRRHGRSSWTGRLPRWPVGVTLSPMMCVIRVASAVLVVVPLAIAIAVAQTPPTPATSSQAGRTASQAPPPTAIPQSYPPEQIEAGRPLFASQCGFCHGRDAAGGESGPDLTRSSVVAEDVRGNKIAPVLRSGRVDKGMPAFNLTPTDMAAIVAFIHDQKTKAESEQGGRRAVDLADLQTGDAEAGKQYFNGAAGCAKCHSPSGDLAGVAKKREGLVLLQRMLYATGGRGGPATARATG